MRGLSFWSSLIMLMVTLASMIVEPSFTVVLRNASFDAMQRWHPRENASTNVKTIDIDEESLRRIGQWPWPRTKLAALVDSLNLLGAKVIVFDMVFAEPDRTSPTEAALLWSVDMKTHELLKKLPDHDQIFAQAIRKANVVMGMTLAEEQATKLPKNKAIFVQVNGNPVDWLPQMPGSVANLKMFEEAALGNGAFNFNSDYDGVIRHVPLLLNLNGTIYPGLSLEALRLLEGSREIVIKSIKGAKKSGGSAGVDQVQIGDLQVPTDSHGQVWLHFSQTPNDRYIPAWKVLAGKVRAEQVKDKTVFIGTSAKGLLDLRFSPLGEMIPGVEVHAQLVDQILSRSWLVRPSWEKAAMALFLIAMWITLFSLLRKAGVIFSVVVGLTAVISTVFLSLYLFVRQGIYIDPLFPALSLGVIFLVSLISNYFVTEKERGWIKGAFSSYISPNLVSHLLANPQQLELGGESRECSFVLTDLEGFTALMEKSEPAVLASVLNDYLEGMVQVVFHHNGTLDRFVGDAVAVMFSAPVHQEDHADRAVACAMERHRTSRRWWKGTETKKRKYC